MTYKVGDPIRAMILRSGGTTLEPATVVEVGHHENQVHDLIPHIVVDFGDGQQRRYSGAGISDYTLPAEKPETAPYSQSPAYARAVLEATDDGGAYGEYLGGQ